MNKVKFHALELVQTNPVVIHIWRFIFLLLIFFIVVLFLPWRQTAEGEGTLIAYEPSERMQSISAPIDGFIDTFYVSENVHVEKGMKLFDMIDPDKAYGQRAYKMKDDFKEQKQNVEKESIVLKDNQESLKEQQKIRTELYDKRYLQAKEQLKSLQLKYTAQQKNYQVEFNQFKRIKELYMHKIESLRAYEKSENMYVNAKIQLDKVKIDIEVQKRHLSMIKQEQKQFTQEIESQIRSLQNKILSAKTRLNILKRDYEKHLTKIARYDASAVVSEKNGSVMRILQHDKNTYIKRGEPVIHFSPDVGVRTILLKVSDFNMPLIKQGLKTRIRFHGWPVLNISGWPAIQFGTFGGIIKKVDPILHEKGFYYAYIMEDLKEPWPRGDVLRIGTNATVWVSLATVPVWYEIWRLMNAFPPKMVTSEKK
ncbi:MAG TPA: hypothetical protein ENK68_01590 [Epsilonproteobacteria bacterium]|nr:hypothetical protein [Campylobacterota bacterium]